MFDARTLEPRLPIKDMERSLEFYHGLLLFELDTLSEHSQLSILKRGNVGIQLILQDKYHPLNPFTIWIDGVNVMDEYNRLAPHAEIEWGPNVYSYGRREFAIFDPDLHRIIFSEVVEE